ncbi:hypothetical protein QTI33_09895 [Variovorax sp. J22P271]|uniref:DUF6537 domain-containing protein n=1 Tax=Variovorax davisae TaxID=3053515 RepID=UPI00257867C0|nr:DUF6537 domain-containing protein [Variovorax sp. J22P271]MDM0032436.1 hypothetical protein [Variovorax sp. J22P271]
MELHRRELTAYEGAALAKRYKARIDAIAAAEKRAGHGERPATFAACGYYMLLARKDEFEVARLLMDPGFRSQIESQFEGAVDFHFHLGGGAVATNHPVTGKPVKRELREWIVSAMKTLAAMRRLRNTWADPWQYSPERKLAAEWVRRYDADVQHIEQALAGAVDARSRTALCELPRVPKKLRGYGHVREAHSTQALGVRDQALERLAAGYVEKRTVGQVPTAA